MRIESRWSELSEFQLHIAERWRERASRIEDPFARFFFCFAGINALYYLWTKIDDARGSDPGRPANEAEQVDHLLAKASPDDLSTLLDAARVSIDFFSTRRPIERMDQRRGRASVGKPGEGAEAQRLLCENDGRCKIGGLGKILYLVRSNLVHGSKMDQGDDEQVVTNSLPSLMAILDWAIKYTASGLGRTPR